MRHRYRTVAHLVSGTTERGSGGCSLGSDHDERRTAQQEGRRGERPRQGVGAGVRQVPTATVLGTVLSAVLGTCCRAVVSTVLGAVLRAVLLTRLGPVLGTGLGTVLGTVSAYAVLAVVIEVRQVTELNTGVIWAMALVWPAWQTAVAIGNVRAIVTDWRARRRRPAPAPVRRPTSLADYMPGSTSPQQRVDRAA